MRQVEDCGNLVLRHSLTHRYPVFHMAWRVVCSAQAPGTNRLFLRRSCCQRHLISRQPNSSSRPTPVRACAEEWVLGARRERNCVLQEDERASVQEQVDDQGAYDEDKIGGPSRRGEEEAASPGNRYLRTLAYRGCSLILLC